MSRSTLNCYSLSPPTAKHRAAKQPTVTMSRLPPILNPLPTVQPRLANQLKATILTAAMSRHPPSIVNPQSANRLKVMRNIRTQKHPAKSSTDPSVGYAAAQMVGYRPGRVMCQLAGGRRYQMLSRSGEPICLKMNARSR